MVPKHLALRPFVSYNLIAAQESPVPLPKYQMGPWLKIFMSFGSKKWNQIYYPFLSEMRGKQIPFRSPNGAPMERDTHLQGIFTSLLTYLFFIFPSESLVRKPLPCSLTGSPWTGILCHQSHCLYIHSFMYVCRSPQKGTLLHMGKNIRSPSMQPHADGRPTYIGVQPGSPRGLSWYYHVYFVHLRLFKDVVNSSDLQ
jgi:hypothetical protein